MSQQPIFDALAAQYGWGCTASISKASNGRFDWIRCTRTPWHEGPHENGSLSWTGFVRLFVGTGLASAALGYPRTTR
ncbi:MAG: hypothetical protein ACRCSL_01195 [Microbacterium sp.]